MIQKHHPLRSGALAAAALLCSLILPPGTARATTPSSTIVWLNTDAVPNPLRVGPAAFKNFSIPAINDAGTIAFATDFIDGNPGTRRGIFDGTGIVADDLTDAPKWDGSAISPGVVKYYYFLPPALNNNGKVAFNAILKPAKNTTKNATLYTNLDGKMRLIASNNGPAYGIANAFIRNLTDFALTDQAIFFTARLMPNSTTPVTAANDEVLWMWKPDLTEPVIVMREGTLLPAGTNFANFIHYKFRALIPAPFSPGHGRSTSGPFVAVDWSVTPTYHAALVCDTTTATAINPVPGIFSAVAPGYVPNLGTISALPLVPLGLPATNGSGHIAALEPVTGSLALPAVTNAIVTGVPSTLYAASYSAPLEIGTPSYTLPAVPAFLALPPPFSPKFTSITDPAYNANGDVATLATAVGPLVNGTNNTCVLYRKNGITICVVRTSAAAADVAGNVVVPPLGNYSAVTEFALPDGTGPLFKANTPGRHGLWAQDSSTAVQLIVRTGTRIPPNTGRTVSTFNALGKVYGSSDQRRSFNATAQVAYSAYFMTGERGIVRVQY